MKRVTHCLILALLMVSGLGIKIDAQEATGTTSVYTVQPGDNAWELAGKYYRDKTKWTRIVDMNPKLREPGRVIEKDADHIVLVLGVGETLVGLEQLGIEPPKAMQIDELMPKPAPPTQVVVTEAGWPWWAVALLMLALVIGMAWSLTKILRRFENRKREQELRRDPITSGTPFVPGGIPATDRGRLTNFFDQQAVNTYATRHPDVERSSIRPTRIGPIEQGTITGEGLVGYLGGEFRPRRIEQPLNAYRARYRFADGTEEDLITLQGCMNPVAYGGDTYRGFTFTSATQAVPTPEPERPAPAPAPHPAIAVRATVAAAQQRGNNTITMGDDVMEFPQGYHVVVDRETGQISLNASAFEMKINPKRVRRNLGVSARGTGTTGTDGQ